MQEFYGYGGGGGRDSYPMKKREETSTHLNKSTH